MDPPGVEQPAQATADSPESGRLRQRAEAAEDRLRSHNLVVAEAEHRLKTRLSVIAAWSTTLDDRWDDLSESMRREGIAVIRRSATELARQASQLLANARAGLVVLDLRPKPVPVLPLLDSTARGFSKVAPDHRIDVDVDPNLRVQADPEALAHVLEHLLENALAYSDAGTTVTLKAVANRERVLIEVVDQGYGVPDGDVFAAFSRGDSSVGTAGAGLGLYIVRNLVEGMAGTVTARRNADAGSTFSISLPAPA